MFDKVAHSVYETKCLIKVIWKKCQDKYKTINIPKSLYTSGIIIMQ